MHDGPATQSGLGQRGMDPAKRGQLGLKIAMQIESTPVCSAARRDRPAPVLLRWKVCGHSLLNFLRRAAASVVRRLPGAWRLLGVPTFRIRRLSDWIQRQRDAHLDWWERRSGPFLEEIGGSVILKRRPPRPSGGGSVHPAFAVERHHLNEPVYVAVLPSAYLLGPNGVVITSDGGVVEESAWGRGYLDNDRAWQSCRLPRAEQLAGRFYTIAGRGPDVGYYHWILDMLPRLMAWERLPTDDVQLIVNTPLRRWQRESLSMLGMENVPVVPLERRHLQLEALYFPSYVGAPSPHPQGCRWLRERLLARTPGGEPRRRLYVSRAGARSRRILNEESLLPVLHEFGFEVVNSEELDFAAQVRLFASAEAVVGPHGAGLTNILFAPPDCKVLEIFEPAYVPAMYYFLADIIEQEYWYLVARPAGRRGPQHEGSGFDDIMITRDELARALQEMFAERDTGRR